MLFTSYAFLGFVFALVVLYYLVPKKFQWMLLLFASYLFYFIAGPKYLIYISVTTLTTYFAADRIGRLAKGQAAHMDVNREGMSKEDRKSFKAAVKAKQRRWLVAGLVLNFGILAVVKYTNFTIANLNALFETVGSPTHLTFLAIALPLGISFYTFKTMAYLIDVHRGKHPPEANVFRLALFVSFFPQLIQGPISRYDELSPSLYAEHRYDWRSVKFGLQRVLWGFFKKLVIADRILVAVNTIIKAPDDHRGVYVLVGMLFYAFQLYADFTGGIDITIGIAEMLGIKVAENFNAPFLAKNITDYWRRWHITMGTWFKDYIFYPLSVSKAMLKLSRSSRQRLGDALGKRIPVYIATLVTWFATGIWHGSSWNFIVWGVLNGLVIIVSQEFEPLYARFHGRFHWKDKAAYGAFEVVRTVLLMSSIRLFDLYRDVPLTFQMFGTMFTTFNYQKLFDWNAMKLGLTGVDYGVLAGGLVVLFASRVLHDRGGDFRQRLERQPAFLRYALPFLMLLAVLLLGAYGMGYDATQFIYNQF